MPQLLFGDSLMNTAVNDYFSDNTFCSNPDGSINLWNFFDLLTSANKMPTYVAIRTRQRMQPVCTAPKGRVGWKGSKLVLKFIN
jgi:hypothetical protein